MGTDHSLQNQGNNPLPELWSMVVLGGCCQAVLHFSQGESMWIVLEQIPFPTTVLDV